MAKLFSLKAGSVLPDAIVDLARKEKIHTAKVEAIGGVEGVKLAYFNHKTKKYEEHYYEEFMEVTGLLGNVTSKDGEPFLHVHGTFGRRDMSTVGGHLVSAKVMPVLEVILSPTRNKALRRFDEGTGLNLVYKTF